jgi:hypothetical protein
MIEWKARSRSLEYAPSAQDLRVAEYRAHFCDGQLKNIVRVDEEADAADKRVYGLASFRVFR